MARYRGTIDGNRGQVSRLGTAASGITADVNGWNIGINIAGRPYGDDADADVFYIYATGGSNAAHQQQYIGRVNLDDDGRPMFTPANNGG